MDFIKNHWEKVLLGVVFVGLAVAVAFLPWKIKREKDDLKEAADKILNPVVKPLEAVNFEAAQAALLRVNSGARLDFATGHRLFNPVLWQKRPDGSPLKVESGKEIGAAAVSVLRILPLYLVVSFDGVTTNDSGVRYVVGIERQAAAKPADRRKRQSYISLNTKTDFFILREVRSGPDGAALLALELNDTAEQVVVARDKPFKRTEGYQADLKYEPENKTWSAQRVDAKLAFGGDDYNIVAINEREVVLSARSGKKTTVRMSAVP